MTGMAIAGLTPTALEQLVAHIAINRVLVAFCQGVDRRDWDQVVACYHDNATDRHGEFEGGPLELEAWMRKNHEYVTSCMHVLSNVSIRVSEDDPRLARVESYCLSRKTVEAAEHDPYLRGTGASGPTRRTVAVRYIDTFQNRVGVGWRILTRTVVHEWMRRDPADAFLPFDESIPMSRRDRSDLLYAPLPRPDR